jgi:hypothetical protein
MQTIMVFSIPNLKGANRLEMAANKNDALKVGY